MPTADPALTNGSVHHGFRLDRVTPLPALRAIAFEFEHVKSGARLLHLAADDTENCFSVTFPTPPDDDTGLPHILEHAVLGGSRRFPVREPFFEMVKMSMATFINAMTSQAYTVYPIATNVKKDFFNLAEVYLDAVFFPELKEETFRREGHHLALQNNADVSSALKITGIVYNEMKGAYSSPESLMYNLAGRGVFPDTALGRDSGGDPDHIPELTFEQFKRFHETRYHPSNARVFIYGDIPTREHLAFLDPVLAQFDRRPAPIATPRQPRWTAPRAIERKYPIGASELTSSRTFITLNWLTGDALDPEQSVPWSVLSYILLGHEAAPLKKAIVDSKLGADIFFTGAHDLGWEGLFSAGVKASEPDRADKFETLVLDTLRKLSTPGAISKADIDAAFQQLAYSNLEVATLFPMRLLSLVNDAWPYGGDPLTYLRMAEHLDHCRGRSDADPDFFPRMIRTHLLDNPHRLRVMIVPDPGAQARADAELAEKLARRRATLAPETVAAIGRDAAALEAAQGVPNPPEALAKLPQLKTSDLPARPRHIPTALGEAAGVRVLHNDVFANGVNYLEVDIDLAGLPADLYPFLPIYAGAVAKMGVANQSFEQVARRRAASTGGLGCSAAVARHAADAAGSLRRMRFSLRTLDAQADNALQLLSDLVFDLDPADKPRLQDILTQSRAWLRTTLVNDGLGTARRHAARGLSPEASLDHLFVSTMSLTLIEGALKNYGPISDVIINQVKRVRDFLANRRRWTVSFTGTRSVFESVNKHLTRWSSRMKDETIRDVPIPYTPYAGAQPRDGLAGAMKVSYCTKVMTAPHLSHPDAPLVTLGTYLARFDYFLPEIRLKGNAYGGGANIDDTTGTFSLFSYRDPRIVETLAVFDGLRAFVESANWSQADVDRAIIGVAKSAERPIRPGEATGTALWRHVRGDTNEMRERRYALTLAATPATIKTAFLRTLDEHEKTAAVCVASSAENLVAANKRLGKAALALQNILP